MLKMAQRHHEQMIIFLTRLGALFLLIGYKITQHLSKLITTVMYVDKLFDNTWANLTNLHMNSPAYHCTVADHIASAPIQKNVTNKSAVARLIINVFIVDFRRLILYICMIVARLPNTETKNSVPRTSVLIIFTSSNTGISWSVIFSGMSVMFAVTVVVLLVISFISPLGSLCLQ